MLLDAENLIITLEKRKELIINAANARIQEINSQINIYKKMLEKES